ncbi:MAG: hypothetical protein CSA66_01635 [Proteobacteria bacterium]|nr:MAG: hypothetical protein CSA66_01635 [Pseudomonadota bacterium]
MGGPRLKSAIATAAVAGWIALVVGLEAAGDGAGAAFPSAPLTIVVHSKPGSAVDLMARRAAEIAGDRCPVPIVVDNRPGTQGVAAMSHVLGAPRDGYTLLAVTRAFLSTLNVTRAGVSVDDFRWIARLVDDPEAVIVNRTSATPDLAALVADADARPAAEPQIWIGPGVGGRDHLMARQTWRALGIRARWIDYKSGPQAVLAMLRGEGAAYVGNAADVAGKPDLVVAAVASAERLPALPQAPTFAEQGVPLEASMWRGFAYADGVPEQAVRYAAALFEALSRDPRWRAYITSTYATPTWDGPAAFEALVAAEDAQTRAELDEAGLITRYLADGPLPLGLVGALLALGVALAALALARRRGRRPPLDALVAAGGLWVALFFVYQTLLFRVPAANVTHPATLPWLWSSLLGGLSLWVLLRPWRPAAAPGAAAATRAGAREALALVAATVAYGLAVHLVGFVVATVPFVVAGARLVGYRDGVVAAAVASLFVVACYGVFDLALGVTLPSGAWLGRG